MDLPNRKVVEKIQLDEVYEILDCEVVSALSPIAYRLDNCGARFAHATFSARYTGGFYSGSTGHVSPFGAKTCNKDSQFCFACFLGILVHLGILLFSPL